MRSKTSCFNPVLCRNYLRRFWPLPVAVLLSVLLLLLLPMVGQLQPNGLTDTEHQISLLTQICNASTMMFVLMLLASLLAAALTFHHLHSRREIQFYHALPLKRRCLFLSCYLTGLGMLAIPFAVGIGLCLVTVAVSGVSTAILPLLELLGAGMAALLIFYALAVIACCVAGQTFGTVLVYGGLNFAVLVIAAGAGNLASMFMPGLSFTHRTAEWLTPVLRLIDAAAIRYPSAITNTMPLPAGFTEPAVFWIYAGVGILLSILSGVLYQIRRSEMSGEMIAFPVLRRLCKLFGALVVTIGGSNVLLASGMIQNNIPFFLILLSILGFGVIGWYAAEMVIQKTLRVFHRRTAATCCVYLLLLACVSLAGHFDVTGVVRYIPEPEDVVSAKVTCFYGNSVQITTEDAEAIHEIVLENRQALSNNPAGNYYPLEISYELENGKQIQRCYWVESDYGEDGYRLPDPISQAALEIFRTPDYCRQSWFGDLDAVTEDNYHYGGFQAYNWDENGNQKEYVTTDLAVWRGDFMELTAKQAAALYQAILRDIENGSLTPWGFEDSDRTKTFGCVDFQCFKEPYSPTYGTYQQYVDTVETTYASVDLNVNMAETIACLEEMGFTFHFD